MSLILRVVALVLFILALLAGLTVISIDADWQPFQVFISAGLAAWVASTLTP